MPVLAPAVLRSTHHDPQLRSTFSRLSRDFTVRRFSILNKRCERSVLTDSTSLRAFSPCGDCVLAASSSSWLPRPCGCLILTVFLFSRAPRQIKGRRRLQPSRLTNAFPPSQNQCFSRKHAHGRFLPQHPPLPWHKGRPTHWWKISLIWRSVHKIWVRKSQRSRKF